MDWLTDCPIAHRGLHSPGAPENTLAAFEAAVDAGYPVECDIRLTADDVPVVFHDDMLDRLTDRDGRVSEMLWADLRGTTVLGSDEGIPRLRSVLQSIDGQVPILAELKTRGLPGPLERAVADQFDFYKGQFAVQSFNPLSVLWVRRHRSDWLRGLLGGDPDATLPERVVARYLLGRRLCRPDFLAYEADRLPAAVVSRGPDVPVLAWTARSPAQSRAALRHADNIIFEEFRP